jgi:DNA repair exonuclease SbcCD ATPase subunit
MIDGRLMSFQALRAQEQALQQTCAEQDTELRLFEAELHTRQALLQRTQAERQNVGDKVGSACGECGKAYSADDLDGALRAIEARLATAQRAVTEAHGAVAEQRDDRDKARQALTDFQASLPDVTQLTAMRGQLQQQQAKLMAVDAQVAARQASVQAQRQAAADRRAQRNPHEDSYDEEVAALESIVEAIAQSEQAMQDKTRQLLLAKAAVDVYAPAGVRAQILDTVTPFLNDRTADYLSVLSDGNLEAEWSTLTRTAKGELREKFAITVSNQTGGKTFRSISGGEKRKVRLATAMALQDLVAARATKPISILFADEIDSALDEAGVERLMTVLEDKARTTGSIFVVSHNPISAIRETVLVRKENGIASIIE